MLTDAQLHTLRTEAGRCLTRVQRLPGFLERLTHITVPEPARSVTFPNLRRFLHDPTESSVHLLSPGAAKHELPAVIPEELTLELEEYRARVEEFARDYLFNAEWSARAAHDALCDDGSVCLPSSSPSYYRLRNALRLPELDEPAGSLIEGSDRHALQELLQAALTQLEGAQLVTQRRNVARVARRRAQRTAARSAKAREAVDQLADYTAPGQGTTKELHSDRSATWDDAIARVEARLAGRTATASQRTAYTRVKPLLNAAVNGSWQAPIPLEQTDADNYFDTALPRLMAPLVWGARTQARKPPSD